MADYTESLGETIFPGDGPATYQYQAGGLVAETVSIQDLFTNMQYLAGAIISEVVTIRDTPTRSLISPMTLADRITITDVLIKTLLENITDGFTVALFQQVALGVTIMAKIVLGDEMVGLATYGQAIADAVMLSEELQWFYGGVLNETMEMSTSLSPVWQRVALVTDGVTIGDTISPLLQMSVTLAENLDLTDEQALQMIYSQVIDDGVCFKVAFVDPGGGVTTWAINTRTSAVTEYQNYAYNSFAQLGRTYLGASSSGLFALDGALDSAELIVARVKTGQAQFTGSRFTAFDAAYLGCTVTESGKTWLLKLHTGDGRTYVYQFRPLDQRTTKVFFGKGLRARYWSWELITAGEDFDLDEIEFVPIGAKRRI